MRLEFFYGEIINGNVKSLGESDYQFYFKNLTLLLIA